MVIFGGIIGIILLYLAIIFFEAWLLMLLLGALHSAAPAVPALGFWLCTMVVFVINVIFRPLSSKD